MASTSVVPNVLFPEPCLWVCVDPGGTLKNAMRIQVTFISWERTGDEAVALVTGGQGLRAVRPQPPRNPDVLCVSPSWLLGTHEDLSHSSGSAVLSLWKDVLLQERTQTWVGSRRGLPWMGPPVTGPPAHISLCTAPNVCQGSRWVLF